MMTRRQHPIPLEEADGVWTRQPRTIILERAERDERSSMLMLDALRPEYREVLMLREFEEMHYAEIAMITGSTESAVKSRIVQSTTGTGGADGRHCRRSGYDEHL